MAKILLITPQMPYPPQQGTSLRNFHILKGLTLNHAVDLLAIGVAVEPASIPDPLNGIRQIWVIPEPKRTATNRLLRLVTDRRPDMAHRLRSSELEQTLSEILLKAIGSDEPYDVVQIEGIELAYTLPIIRGASPGSRIVFDDHNAEAELQRRAFITDTRQPGRWPAAIYSYLQTLRLRKYEAWACQAADWVTAVSNKDRDHLLRIVPTANISVVPNSIDVAQYYVGPGSMESLYDLVFTGKMDYRPNVDAVLWFAREVWPRVIKEKPGAKWVIAGQKPHRRLAILQEEPGITLTGWVETVLPYISQSSVFIMPFRIGSGTRLKLIEAMAAGKAIVSTTVGAEGFDVEHGDQLLLADTPGEFADQVLLLIDNSNERARLGMNAQSFAQEYDWRKITPIFDKIYAQLLSQLPMN